jgi:hypothetical membrane protein
MFRNVKALSSRFPMLGPLFFISGVQYFCVQIIVALRFSPRYSLARNTVSDLGNTVCGLFNDRVICSPLHSFMNVSFCMLGLAMMAGSLLLLSQYKKSRGITTGFSLFALGGFGVVLVGIFPENTIAPLHSIGAGLPFVFGNLGLVILGTSFGRKSVRVYTFLTGAIALLAFGVYVNGHYFGLGEGGIERIVAYPQTIWMLILGSYCYFKHKGLAL